MSMSDKYDMTTVMSKNIMFNTFLLFHTLNKFMSKFAWVFIISKTSWLKGIYKQWGFVRDFFFRE